MDLTNTPDLKNLGLAVSQVQGSVGLAHIQDPKNLVLAISQAQYSIGLTNMLDLKNLNWQLVKPKIEWVWQTRQTQRI